MSQPHPGRRRRRPRKRLRYRGKGLPPRSHSYQAFGLKSLYDLVLPGIRGGARRRFFNDVSAGVALWYGVLGALLGWAMLGPFGVVIGFGAGVTLGADFLTRKRFFRP
jgi:hypothetical protein